MKLLGIFLISTLLILSSCGKGGETEVIIKVTPSSAYIVPGDITLASGLSVTGPRIGYSKLTLTWKLNQPLYVVAFNIKFLSPFLTGGAYRCNLNGKDLNYIFTGATDFNNGEVSPAASGSIEINSSAGFACGSVKVLDSEQSFRATGVMKLLGYTIDSDGNQRPISAQTSIAMEYVAF